MTTLNDLSDSLADAVTAISKHVVGLRGNRFIGTGVSLGDHRFVTASRGLSSGETLTVRLPDGTTTEGRVVARDRGTGLALVQADGADLAAATFVDDVPRTGQIALLIGRGERISAGLGLISDVGPAWTTAHGTGIDAYIDVDATLPWGFPGGPLADARGQVIGINLRDLTRGGTTVPASTVRRVVDKLQTRGERAPGFLGVGAVPVALGADQAEVAGQGSGLLVVSLDDDGPSASQLAVGDIILALDGVGLDSVQAMKGRLADLGSGHETTVRVLRGAAVTEVVATLSKRPARSGGRRGRGPWGGRGRCRPNP